MTEILTTLSVMMMDTEKVLHPLVVAMVTQSCDPHRAGHSYPMTISQLTSLHPFVMVSLIVQPLSSDTTTYKSALVSDVCYYSPVFLGASPYIGPGGGPPCQPNCGCPGYP